jgi:hypothetical protein
MQLAKEYMLMEADPPPFVWGRPDEKNILNCELMINAVFKIC